MSKEYQHIWFTVPAHILDLPGLTLSYLRIYETIFQFWNHNKPCFLTNEMIKKRTGVTSDSTIASAFQYFEEHKQMERKVVNGRRYLCRPDAYISIENDQINEKEGSRFIEGGVSVDREGGLDGARHNNKNIKYKNNNKKKDLKSLSASDDAQDRFEEFFSVYPRKINRKRSYEIWRRKQCNDMADQIINDIKNRILNDSQWKDQQFIPHPSTYLNQERWNDELTLEKQKASGKPQTAFQRAYESLKRSSTQPFSQTNKEESPWKSLL